MANFDLRSTGGTNIQTTFRYELEVAPDNANTVIGLEDRLTAFVTRCELPGVTSTTIPWFLPGGMKNHQAGRGETKEITMDFVICSEQAQSWYKTLERWREAAYDLNDGSNKGKALYCTDGISIRIKGEDKLTKYRFRLLRAQITNCDYKEVGSETQELLKASATLVYDMYEIYDGKNVLVQTL